jgi:hypothetical protein
MRKLSDEQWQSLASVLEGEVARLVPGWTAPNTHDPGITVLEVLTYALTDLHYRVTLSASHRELVQRVSKLAETLSTETGADDGPPGPQRVNFFFGRQLGADDFTAEQNYVIGKARRLNRLLHGVGVVSGLGVTVERTGSSARVVIAPGFALDACGREIEVSTPTPLPLPAQGTSLLVLLHYAEQPCHRMPASSPDPQAQAAFSRITETFDATLAPTAGDKAVALARVKFSRKRWTLDPKFKTAKFKRAKVKT